MWLWTLIFLLLLIICLYHLNKSYNILNLCRRIKTIDGSKLKDKIFIVPGNTVFGNTFDVVRMSPEQLFTYLRQLSKDAKGRSYIWYYFTACVYNITTVEDAEQLFTNTGLITKAKIYALLKPFLGEGLLMSSNKKWQFRRKILTPAFHFNILQSFTEIFKEESLKLLNKLQKYENHEIDVADIMAQFTLNTVCETAMGVVLDNVPGSEYYRKIIHKLEKTIVRRLYYPLMYFDSVFYLFGEYKKQMNFIEAAHDFSSRIIKTKREEYLNNRKTQNEPLKDEFNLKKRYAMLDTLLEEEAKGLIDHAGICDEVNTFMFEGYDTTSVCLIFTILNLALNKDIQEKCRAEIQYLDDFNALSIFDFNKLEYLECVLKETLRMYPSVPFIGRACTTDTVLNGLLLPKNAQVYVHIYDVMRDPKHFPEPNVFKPERFLSDVSNKIHPFAFIPFSAGSRNCIGQKFALLEMKAVLVVILKNFEILPVTKLEDLQYRTGLILRTREKIFVKLKKITQ